MSSRSAHQIFCHSENDIPVMSTGASRSMGKPTPSRVDGDQFQLNSG